jgi:nanoRNase/pAp phosphatase (c-di-AMP/oligoRNAs hydrolase)
MRLITRSDFDGLACGAILKCLGYVDEWKFVHPKDIQDGLVHATDNDILANIPYVKGCALWFDHHSSETERLGRKVYFEGVSRKAPSCARVVYDFYGGDANPAIRRFSHMIEYVDRVDSGNLTQDEIVDPKGWILLGFIMDPRTGLGRFKNFTIGNYELMEKLAEACRTMRIEQILELPDVKERLDLYFDHIEKYKVMLKEHAKPDGNVILIDLRGVDPIYAGNRFVIYTLFPEQNISVWTVDGKANAVTVVTVGYSIINRTASLDVGSLLLKYGGGGHRQVGTCQVPYEEAERVIAEIIEKCRQ